MERQFQVPFVDLSVTSKIHASTAKPHNLYKTVSSTCLETNDSSKNAIRPAPPGRLGQNLRDRLVLAENR